MIFTLFGLEFQVYDSAEEVTPMQINYWAYIKRYGRQCGNGSIMGCNVLGCSMGQVLCSKLPLRFFGKIGKEFFEEVS